MTLPIQPQWPMQTFLFFLTLCCFSLVSYAETEIYYSYLGGTLSDTAYAIATDDVKNIYIAGASNSERFDGFRAVDNKKHFNQNCFVVRLNLQNPSANYYFEFAGSERESCRAIAVDSARNVYVTGETQSADLPVTTSIPFAGESDTFLFKLNATGTLVYASYIGGARTDYGHGLAIRGIDDVFIAGETWSEDFPTTENAFIRSCQLIDICDGKKANAFVTQIDTSKPSQYISQYSTYLGGIEQDKAHAIAIDSNGIVHIVGETGSDDFPLVNQISDHLRGSFDGFISQIDPTQLASNSLIFSSYFGGNGDDFITAIATDPRGNSYFVGRSTSDDFPTTVDAFSQRCANGKIKCLASNPNQQHSDVFISKLFNQRIVYSSLFGGTRDESAQAIDVDTSGNIYVSGFTRSDDFPLTNNALDNRCNTTMACNEKDDAFLLKLDPNLNKKDGLIYSTYLGGDDSDTVRGLQIGSNGFVYLTGQTFSAQLASSQAIDKKIANGEAYIQEIEISSIGQWVNDEIIAEKKTSTSAIDPYQLILFFVYLTIRQTSTKRKIK